MNACCVNPLWYIVIFILFMTVFIILIKNESDNVSKPIKENPPIIAAIVLASIGMGIMLYITSIDNSYACQRYKKKNKQSYYPNLKSGLKRRSKLFRKYLS